MPQAVSQKNASLGTNPAMSGVQSNRDLISIAIALLWLFPPQTAPLKVCGRRWFSSAQEWRSKARTKI